MNDAGRTQKLQGKEERRPPFFWVDNVVYDCFARLIGATGLAVYGALARHCNRSRQAWPSIRGIARQLKIRPARVIEALRSLVSAGLIALESAAGKATVYTLLDVEPCGSSECPRCGRTVSQAETPTVSQAETPPMSTVSQGETLPFPRGKRTVSQGETEQETRTRTTEQGKDTSRPPASTPLPPKTKGDPRVQPTVAYWCETYWREIGDAYPVVGGRDGELLHRLPASFTAARLRELVDAFWLKFRGDAFLRNRGATIPAFVQAIPALSVARPSRRTVPAAPAIPELDALRA